MCEMEQSKKNVIYTIKNGKIISKTYKHPTPSIKKYQTKKDILKAISIIILFTIIYTITKFLCPMYPPISKLAKFEIAYFTNMIQFFIIVMIILTIVKIVEYIILLVQDYRNNKNTSE